MIVPSIGRASTNTNRTSGPVNVNVIRCTQFRTDFCHGVFVHAHGAGIETKIGTSNAQSGTVIACRSFGGIGALGRGLFDNEVLAIQRTRFPIHGVVGETLCSLSGILVRTIVDTRNAIVFVPIGRTVGQTRLNEICFGTVRNVFINGQIDICQLIVLANANGLEAR